LISSLCPFEDYDQNGLVRPEGEDEGDATTFLGEPFDSILPLPCFDVHFWSINNESGSANAEDVLSGEPVVC